MITIARMSEMAYRNLRLSVSNVSTPFGEMLAAMAGRDLCYLGFVSSQEQALQDLIRRFPFATLIDEKNDFNFFVSNISLNLYATDFQFSVWQALLQIPYGETTTYKAIAERIGMPKAIRAVGTAVGKNPISVLIPCHRVISSDGTMGGYFWGLEKKKEILDHERCRQKKRP